MRWNLHGIVVEGESDWPALREAWGAIFSACSAAPDGSSAPPAQISCRLDRVALVPETPRLPPILADGAFASYYLVDGGAIAHFPRFGQLRFDFAGARTTGLITEDALLTYGVIEDLIAVSLSAHLRRRGFFLVHAFAAALDGRVALIVGGIGAGKTTTGLSLLAAGWRLVSNDSPIVDRRGQVLSYPGPLAAAPDSFERFEATRAIARRAVFHPAGRKKLAVPAESVWPGVWTAGGPARAILFPRIEARTDHQLEPLSESEALRELLPHSIERWDPPMMPEHLRALKHLVATAPAFRLRLGPEVASIPSIVARAMGDQ